MAKVKLNTKLFSSMLSKVSKCTNKGGIDLLSELVEIKLSAGILSLRTTDTRNIMVLRQPGIEGDDFEATISIDVFEKIVSKTSKEEIELSIDDRSVELRGNGTYHFPLTIEGDEPVTFPPIKVLEDPDVKQQFSLKKFLDVLKYNGPFVGSPFVDPTLSGFYFAEDSVISADTCTCCYLNEKFLDEPFMLFTSTLSLLSELTDDQVLFVKKGRKIQFVSSTCLIDSSVHTDQEEFPKEDLDKYLDTELTSSIKISKKDAISILERVSLFVDMKTEFGATIFDFTEKGVVISDKGGKASELLPYKDAVNFQPFQCYVAAGDLIKVLDIDGDDEISLRYADPTVLRIDVGKVTRVIALLDPGDLDNADDFVAAMDKESAAAAEDFAEASIDEPVQSPEVVGDALSDIAW